MSIRRLPALPGQGWRRAWRPAVPRFPGALNRSRQPEGSTVCAGVRHQVMAARFRASLWLISDLSCCLGPRPSTSVIRELVLRARRAACIKLKAKSCLQVASCLSWTAVALPAKYPDSRRSRSRLTIRIGHTSLEFGVVTAAAGQYRLCWCGGQTGCTDAEQFKFDAGSFTLLGPGPLEQHRTCVSGQPCAIEGLTGIGLEDLNAGTFSVLETCGIAPWRSTFPPASASQPFRDSCV